MQLVNDKYYFWYNRIATLAAAILLILVVGIHFAPGLEHLQSWGLRPIIGLLTFGQLAYGTLFYRQKAGNNIWIATLISVMLLSLVIFGLVHNSGQFHSAWVVALFIQILASGMFGSYPVVGYGFLVTIYYILVATGESKPVVLEPFASGILLGSYIACAISIMFWKRFYIGQESQKISQLTGQLKGKEQQAEILIQSISDGIIVTDTEGKINLLNPAAAVMTGWPVEEAMGIDIKLVLKLQQEDGKDLPDEDAPVQKVLTTSAQNTGTLRLVRRNNSFAVVSLVVSPIILPKSKDLLGTVAVLRDVSEARAEENRRADFISTASHEMRTPVAAIEGYLALALNDKVSQVDAKARSYLVKAHESTQRLGKLFQDLLTSAKAEDGRLVNHPQVIEMSAYLQELADGLRFAAEKKGLLMNFELGTSGQEKASIALGNNKVIKPLYYTSIDPDRMREVITNLFDNAVKYTETGKITLALTGNDEVVQFFIKDTGPGIPPEDLPHLFQKFYRVDNSTTRTIGGTGLGLFICRKIVELYHGRIWAESEISKGSTFYINLPRLSSAKAAELLKTQTVKAGLQL